MAPLKRLAATAPLALALAACAPASKPVLLEAPASTGALDRRWERYGAYYLVDELFLETSFEASFAKTPVNKYVINKRIKILTPEGARFGTVEVPVYSAFIAEFRAEHFDSAGRPVKVPLEAVRAEFGRSGKLVFPNVAPGSVLAIRIAFSTSSAVTIFEHWFSGPIPVAEGRFTFSYLDTYDFDFKAYGPARDGHAERLKGSERLTYRTWSVRNAYPRSSVEYQEDVDETEPRVAAVLRRFQGQEVFESWEAISGQYEKHALKTSFFRSTRRLGRLTDSLAGGKATQAEKAAAAFGWLQKNVSYKSGPLKAINPDKVVASGQGNLWEIAVALREMFRHLGLRTDVLVTRPRSLGGFDHSFISPAQLGVPLVTVTADKRTYLAFPFSKGAALGEYPLDYHGLQSLSLADGKSEPLPGFASERSYSRMEARVRPDDGTAPAEMDLELGGYLAFAVRNSLMEERKQDVEEAYQRILARRGSANDLVACDVQGLDKPGRPVLARLRFENPDQTVRRKGEILMQLSHLFPAHFTAYDTTRSSGFKSDLEIEHVEAVRAPKVAGKALAPAFHCRDLDNALFRTACATEERADEVVLKRTLTVRRKRLSAAEMRAIAGDILELNRVRESSLVWKAAGEPAAATGSKGKR